MDNLPPGNGNGSPLLPPSKLAAIESISPPPRFLPDLVQEGVDRPHGPGMTPEPFQLGMVKIALRLPLENRPGKKGFPPEGRQPT